MSDTLVCKRYAKALFRLCEGNQGLQDEALSVLNGIADLYKDDSICKVLVSPSIPKDLKLQVLEHVNTKEGKGSSQITNFIKVAVDAGRVEIFKDLSVVFRNLLFDSRGITEAIVTSVTPLSDDDVEATRKNIENLTGRKVDLTFEQDPELLGGFIVRMGNSIIDLSLKSRLNRLARGAIV